MKKCTSCAKDLPDTAMHCVFCGAKQAAAAPAPNPNAKTVLGYSAADLLKQAGIQQPAAPAPQGFPPPQQFQQPPQQPQFAPPPQQFQPPQQPQFAPPPPAQGGQFGGSATAATVFMQNAPQIPQQPAQPMPAPYQPPPQQMGGGMPAGMPAPAPFQPPPQQMGGGMGMPGPSPYPPPGGQPMGGMPYNPQPVGMPGQPPFLASQTAARMDKPVEPFNDSIKLVCLIFGACLLASFLVPISLSPFVIMAQGIGSAPGLMKLALILVGLGGAVGVVLGVTPGMQPMQRGLIAAAVGLVPILMFGTFVLGGFDWHFLVYPLGGILIPTGLLLRDQYPTDKLPRLFVFAGAACIALPFFLPFRVFGMLRQIIESIAHPGALVDLAAGFVPLVLATLAVLLALIPGRAKFGAKQLAWAWFLFPPAFAIAAMTAHGSIVDVLTKGPGNLFGWAGLSLQSLVGAAASSASDGSAGAKAAAEAVQGFALPLYTGFAAMATWGLCVLFGKQLEMSK